MYYLLACTCPAAASSCWSTILLGTMHIGIRLNLEHCSMLFLNNAHEGVGGGGGGGGGGGCTTKRSLLLKCSVTFCCT